MSRFGTRARLLALGLPVVAASAAAVVVAAPGQAATPRSATVTLGSTKFMAKQVVIARGGAVTWRWAGDGIRHNVTWVGGRKPAASSSTKSSGTYRVRFARAGTYRYECTIHAGIGMVGTVVVR